MSKRPRITVVMPSYNQAKYLDEAIKSVVTQSEKPYEFFIYDAGSKDGSYEIIQKYSDQITWWVSEKDDGQSDVIRRGFEKATGDVVCWLNSDDLLLPGALEKVADTFEQNPELDVVSGYLLYIDENDCITDCPHVPTGIHWQAVWNVINVNQQATFFKNDLVKRVGGPDASLHCAMDGDLWTKIIQSGAKWKHVNQQFGAFRKHSEAKGGKGAWYEKYQAEGKIVRARYPELLNNAKKRKVGLFLYRVSQVLTMRQLQAKLETGKYRGKPISSTRWAIGASKKE